MPRAASWAIASSAGSPAGTSRKVGRGAKLASTVWLAFIVSVSGLAQPAKAPSTVQPRKTWPASGVAVRVGRLPGGERAPAGGLPPPALGSAQGEPGGLGGAA